MKVLSLISRYIEIWNKRQIDWTSTDELIFGSITTVIALVIIGIIWGIITLIDKYR